MTQRENQDKSENRIIKGKGDADLPHKDRLEHAEDAKHSRNASKAEHQQALDLNKNKHSGSAGGQGESIEVFVRDAHGKEQVAASRHVAASEKEIAKLQARMKPITPEELHRAAKVGDIAAAKLFERMSHAKNHDELASVQKEANKLYGRGEFAINRDDAARKNQELHDKHDTDKQRSTNKATKKQRVDTGILEAIEKDGTVSREKRKLAAHLQEMRSATKKMGGSTEPIDGFAQQELSKEIAAKQKSNHLPDLKDQILRGIIKMGVEDLKVKVGVVHGTANFVVNTLAGIGNAVRIAGAAAYQGTPISAICPDLYPDKEATQMLHKTVETTAVAGRVLVQLQTTFNPTSPLYGVEYDQHGAAMTRALAKAIPQKIGDELHRLAHADTEEKAAVATEAVLNIATLVETGGFGAAAKVGELMAVNTIAKVAEDGAALAEVSNIAKVAKTTESVEHLNPAGKVVKAITKNLETQAKDIAHIAENRPSLKPLAEKMDECATQLRVATKEEQGVSLRVHDEYTPAEGPPKAPEGMKAGGKEEGNIPSEADPLDVASGDKNPLEKEKHELSVEEIEKLKAEAGSKRYPEVSREAKLKQPSENEETTKLIKDGDAERTRSKSNHERLRRRNLGEPREAYNWAVRNERFSDDVVRQSEKLSCVDAVGEMISNGVLKEAKLKDDIGVPGDYDLLVEQLGDNRWMKGTFESLSRHPGNGPWLAEFVENAWTDMKKSLHVVAVDGFSIAEDIVHIRDPWEGTKYDMTVKEFEHIWSGLTILRVRE